MAARPAYPPTTDSGLQMDTRNEARDTYKEAVHPTSHVEPYGYAPPNPPLTTEQKKRICGLAPRTFYIVVAVLVLVATAAAVGGGVGGSLASKKSSSNSSSSTSSSGSTSTSATNNSTSGAATITSAPSSPPLTTTATIGASTTLLVDCPSSNNTVYSANGALFRKVCGNDLLNANSANVVDQPTDSLDACIDLCAGYNLDNATQIAAGHATVCNTVCWRATIEGDDYPGQCFGFATQNSSGGFVFHGDAKCDSAAWINQNYR